MKHYLKALCFVVTTFVLMSLVGLALKWDWNKIEHSFYFGMLFTAFVELYELKDRNDTK